MHTSFQGLLKELLSTMEINQESQLYEFLEYLDEIFSEENRRYGIGYLVHSEIVGSHSVILKLCLRQDVEKNQLGKFVQKERKEENRFLLKG